MAVEYQNNRERVNEIMSANGNVGEAIRDRIKELRRVPASELRPNPRNWRRHPSDQSDSLAAVLREVGYADALLARETPEGLELIDGHLRRQLTPDQVVPVLILDVTEQEANKILLTLDPLAAMARADKDHLDALLRDVTTGDAALQEMLADLARDAGVTPPDFQPATAGQQGNLDQTAETARCPNCGAAL
jgi:ParB/Sulfiredoxin domain